MTQGKKILDGLKEALEVAQCGHVFVYVSQSKEAVTARHFDKKVCQKCGGTFYFFKTFGNGE